MSALGGWRRGGSSNGVSSPNYEQPDVSEATVVSSMHEEEEDENDEGGDGYASMASPHEEEEEEEGGYGSALGRVYLKNLFVFVIKKIKHFFTQFTFVFLFFSH